MIEKIQTDLYRLEIPLPENPLKAINSYLIKAQERSLLIDTGMNLPECKNAMLSALKELSVDLAQTDFFLTHFHMDHTDLVPELATGTSTVYFNRVERLMLNTNWRQQIPAYYRSHGFPDDELGEIERKMPSRRSDSEMPLIYSILKEGDVLKIGNYSFKCIETPGHSPGHMCLYEPDKKILLSGDHILFGITSHITAWPGMEDLLKKYLTSLEKLYNLEVNLMLPGHRSIQRTHNIHRRRIRELQAHHKARADEIMAVLGKGGQTAYQIAPCLTWEIKYDDWGGFPPIQKIFAVGEVIAHLKYLEEQGKVRSRMEAGTIVFALVQ